MKLKLVVAAFLATSMMLNAQGKDRLHRQGEGERKVTAEMRVDRMAEHLSLTAAEKAKVLELFKSEELKMQAVKEEVKVLRQKNEKISEEQKAKFEALRKSHEADLEKIIGKEKMAKHLAERAEKKHDMHKMVKMHTEMHRQMDMHREPNRPMQGQMDKPHQQGQMMGRMQNIKEKFTPERRAEHMKSQLGLSDSEKTALVELFTMQEKQLAVEREQKIEAMKKANDSEIQKIIGKERMAKFNEIRETKKEKVKEFHHKKEI